MDYQKIYNQLIEKGQIRLLEEYSENHHIIPSCLGGTNSKSNLVKLTPEEHYLAHQLLAKIYPTDYGLLLACRLMCTDKEGKRINNKEFGWIKRKISIEQSIRRKGQTKENNDGIAKMAKTLSNRTKEDYEYLQHHSEVMSGRNKENNKGIALMIEKRTGWTKENHQGTAATSEALTGRTKETHEYLRIMAEKKKGQTKETHPSIAKMAEKNNILSIELRNILVQKRNNGETYQSILDWLISLNIKISYGALPQIFKREMKERSK